MVRVNAPQEMNDCFARAFNSRRIENLLALYEKDAILLVDGSGDARVGHDAISRELEKLLQAPGIMVSSNNFCVVHGDIALLRADFTLRDGHTLVASGSTAELVRKQSDGSWLYVVDHAVGASLPPVVAI